MRLPKPAWRIKSNGPAGTNRFMAVVSSTPDRFAGLGIPAGPFAKVNNTAGSAKDIVMRLITPAQNCGASEINKRRDFEAEADPCSSSYGAGLVDIEEVN